MTSTIARVGRFTCVTLLASCGSLLGLVACSSSPGAVAASPQAQSEDAGSSSSAPSESDAGSTVGIGTGGGDDAGNTPTSDAGVTTDAGTSAAPEGGNADAQPPASSTRLVGYLPNYNGSYADWAAKLNFSKMTHLNLAFADVPACASSTCTSNDDMTFSTGDDNDIAAIVSAAHAAGVKVLISVGGGGSTNPLTGDQTIIQFFKAGLSTQLVASLDSFVAANGFDGVDLDIESPSEMGTPYATFVSALVSTFRPEGKLITAAMAQWIQSGIPDSALHQFDFINIMAYSNLSDSQTAMSYYSGLNVPANQIVLGVKFFGDVQDPNDDEPEYSDILSHYPNAWQSDSVSGDNSYYGGDTILYTGEATMAKEVALGAQYGGIMIWELTGDAPAPHSLLTIVQNNL